MKLTIKNLIVSGVLLIATASCSFFETDKAIDPNAPSVDAYLTNPNLGQINELVTGLQFSMRGTTATVMGNFYRIGAGIGREAYQSVSSDSRWQTEILGTIPIDPAGIFNVSYNGFAATRRRAEIFIKSTETSNSLSAEEKLGAKGFANTVKAYVLLNQLNLQGKNGIRITFTDLNAPGDGLKPGKFVSYEEALAEIKKIVDEGDTQLAGAGNAFAFTLTSGYTGFNTPANFRKFNRAIAARVAMYQKDFPSMLTAVNASFLSLNGSLIAGPVFTFSITAGDIPNPFFKVVNDNNTPDVVHPSFITEAEVGDKRVTSKTRLRATPRAVAAIPGKTYAYEVALYTANTQSAPIIKNEELVLMYAEANIQTGNLAEAVKALDVVRVAAGLPTLAVAKPTVVSSKDLLITELLNQRRYSLFFEGHRWFDMRRYNLLATLPLDAPSHKVYELMPRPQSEVDWDVRNPQ